MQFSQHQHAALSFNLLPLRISPKIDDICKSYTSYNRSNVYKSEPAHARLNSLKVFLN